MQKVRFLLLEIKSAMACILGTLAGFAAIILLLTAIVFAANTLNDSDNADLMQIGVVMPDNDIYSGLLTFANSMTGLKGLCSLSSCSYEEAMTGLNDGSFNLVILIPDDFFDKALHMQETEFSVLLTQSPGKSEQKLMSLFSGVEHLMLVVESSICSVYKGMETYDFSFTRSDMENALTDRFMSAFADREYTYDVTYLTPYGSYPALSYYLTSFTIIAVLISSVSLISLYRTEDIYLERILYRSTLARTMAACMKIIALTCSIFVLLVMALCAMHALSSLDLFSDLTEGFYAGLSAGSFFAALLLAFSMALAVHIFSLLLSCDFSGHFAYMLIVLLLALLGGGIIPTVRFPLFFEKLSLINPFTYWHKMLLGCTLSDYSSVLSVCIINLILAFIGIRLYIRRLNGKAVS